MHFTTTTAAAVVACLAASTLAIPNNRYSARSLRARDGDGQAKQCPGRKAQYLLAQMQENMVGEPVALLMDGDIEKCHGGNVGDEAKNKVSEVLNSLKRDETGSQEEAQELKTPCDVLSLYKKQLVPYRQEAKMVIEDLKQKVEDCEKSTDSAVQDLPLGPELMNFQGSFKLDAPGLMGQQQTPPQGVQENVQNPAPNPAVQNPTPPV